ncbi:methyltransferase domain-containing protein [Streptomyces solicathayae]|uniref:Class I SAM-dependent methyltransferase n=1 Tax=Streptomyces solicathayae TaxID=3081768 RepID=A0ABZ0LWS4_9ACTN|nr:methyltransferase domain-containing protein [Streptomyces sp. HUAS YS2]WOX23965.1 class I SAM-dependent methyltransferase [Streptomyces sp. HUAS YS2]
MPSLLSNRLAQRMLRPAFSLVEQRMERVTTAFQTDLDALHHEVADLRRRQYGLSLLLDRAGRDGDRMPTATQIDTLVREVAAVTGRDRDHARREVTVAYRHLVAVEALGTGGLAGTLSDVCGRLAAVPQLAPPNGEVLEIGTGHGLFAAALRRMLHRGGVEARLTVVDPLADAPDRAELIRGNLALGGADGAGTARLVRGDFARPEIRAQLADRHYGIVVVNTPQDGPRHDLEQAAALAAPDALILVMSTDRSRADSLRPAGRIAQTRYLRTAPAHTDTLA